MNRWSDVWWVKVEPGPNGPSIPFSMHYYACKGELALSRTGRLSYVASKAMARFDTREEAEKWLAGMKKKAGAEYEVSYYQEWVKS